MHQFDINANTNNYTYYPIDSASCVSSYVEKLTITELPLPVPRLKISTGVSL